MSLGVFTKQSKETSLEVWWLRIHTSTAGSRVPSLVGELRSYMPCDACLRAQALQPKKKKERKNRLNDVKVLRTLLSTRRRCHSGCLLLGWHSLRERAHRDA